MHDGLPHWRRDFWAATGLLLEAKQRIQNNPGRYYQNRVYGENDNGGTQALYLSRVPFEKLGLPELGPESVPARTLRWQRRFYQYFALPACCMPDWCRSSARASRAMSRKPTNVRKKPD